MKGPYRAWPKWLEWVCWIGGALFLCVLGFGFVYTVPMALGGTKLIHEKAPKDTAGLLYLILLAYGPLVGNLFWLWMASIIVRLPGKRRRSALAPPDLPVEPAGTPPPEKTVPDGSRNTRWNSCNVFQTNGSARRVWHFNARGEFKLNHEETVPEGEPLPAGLVAKTWTSLWQRKLNVAWLPPENVFVRVAQFPRSSPDETRAMVEFQLEKLSPIPVTQAVWSLHVLRHAAGNLQTVVVVIAARSVVEEFLGRLEGQRFLADRLELPLLDQLQATPIHEDGAWIYPEGLGGHNTALVAWWYGGVLQTVDLLMLPPGPDRAVSIRDQLTQMAWAGELEGWLTSPPHWHLVAENEKAAEWEPPLRAGLDQRIELAAPLPPVTIASLTARRAVQADPNTNLLPPEFAARYQQQFVDRLWMRGVGAAVGLYVAGLVVYFVALVVLGYQTKAVETDVKTQGPAYTNALQLTQQYRILKERQDLKYAGLDCYEAVAECQPENVSLETLNFSEGKILKLSGSAPQNQMKDVIDFIGKLRKQPDSKKPGQLLFDPSKGEQLQTHPGANGSVIWSFGLELIRTEQR